MGIDLNEYQTTLKSQAMVSGVGVHSGKTVVVNFLPADPDTGIVFHRTGKNGDFEEIRAQVSEIAATALCTVLGSLSSAYVATIEHLMAALSALGIDNLIVEIDGDEMPILDGSAGEFVDVLDQAGIEILDAKRRYIRILKPVRMENGLSWAEFRPYDGTRFEIEIDFPTPAIGRQAFAADVDADLFRRDIARARTFGFLADVERLWAAGYGLGASLENSIVIGEQDQIINPDGLRFKDEFVRHKMLDAIGDLALAGARFIGCFRSFRGGHRINAAALRELLSDRSAFEIVETTRRETGRSAELITVNAPVYAPWTL